jgi:hypothetical protein
MKCLLEADPYREQNFTAEEIVVLAWSANQKLFGLEGYEDQYPDSNKILSSLMGRFGLVTRGDLIRTKAKRYRIATETQKKAHLKALKEMPENTVALRKSRRHFINRLRMASPKGFSKNPEENALANKRDLKRILNVCSSRYLHDPEEAKRRLTARFAKLSDDDSGDVSAVNELRRLANLTSMFVEKFWKYLVVDAQLAKRRQQQRSEQYEYFDGSGDQAAG